MQAPYVLTFDVGGTQIKAAVVAGGVIVESTVSSYESHAEESADDIVAHLAQIACDLVHKLGYGNYDIVGAGFAFPGPFDYASGISLIRGLGKYESLYGLNLAAMLERAFHSNETLRSRLALSFRIAFENDAALFGLGEASYGMAKGARKAICLTIGTGLGSCYLENGFLVKSGVGVPSQGWLYAVSYLGGIADDYISKRGVLQLADELGIAMEERDVRCLALMALAGEPDTQRLFQLFGRRMATILASSLHSFQPNLIVLGGQISKSVTLFVPAFQAGLLESGIQPQVVLSSDTQTSVFKGIYDFVLNEKIPGDQ